MKRMFVTLLSLCTTILLVGCGSSNTDKINQLAADYKEVLCKAHKLSGANSMSNLAEVSSLTSKSLQLAKDAEAMKSSLSEAEAKDLVQKMAQAALDAQAGRCD